MAQNSRSNGAQLGAPRDDPRYEMITRLGRAESDTELVRETDNTGSEAPARRYASFVVRGWRPGTTGALEVAHDQSGERVRTDSLVEVIGWIQSRSAAATPPARGAEGETPQPIR